MTKNTYRKNEILAIRSTVIGEKPTEETRLYNFKPKDELLYEMEKKLSEIETRPTRLMGNITGKNEPSDVKEYAERNLQEIYEVKRTIISLIGEISKDTDGYLHVTQIQKNITDRLGPNEYIDKLYNLALECERKERKIHNSCGTLLDENYGSTREKYVLDKLQSLQIGIMESHHEFISPKVAKTIERKMANRWQEYKTKDKSDTKSPTFMMEKIEDSFENTAINAKNYIIFDNKTKKNPMTLTRLYDMVDKIDTNIGLAYCHGEEKGLRKAIVKTQKQIEEARYIVSELLKSIVNNKDAFIESSGNMERHEVGIGPETYLEKLEDIITKINEKEADLDITAGTVPGGNRERAEIEKREYLEQELDNIRQIAQDSFQNSPLSEQENVEDTEPKNMISSQYEDTLPKNKIPIRIKHR